MSQFSIDTPPDNPHHSARMDQKTFNNIKPGDRLVSAVTGDTFIVQPRTPTRYNVRSEGTGEECEARYASIWELIPPPPEPPTLRLIETAPGPDGQTRMLAGDADTVTLLSHPAMGWKFSTIKAIAAAHGWRVEVRQAAEPPQSL